MTFLQKNKTKKILYEQDRKTDGQTTERYLN